MKNIHINCDLGEGGEFDAELMPLISACNIACGGHAGNQTSMHQTVKLAIANNVEIGAHPSYPDKDNFGRKSLDISNEELNKNLLFQLRELQQVVEKGGGKITHIKPHGALYNDAAKDENIAEIVLESILEFDKNLILYVPPYSTISTLAKGKIKLFFEAFADRNYHQDYSLVSRSDNNALLTKKEQVFSHLNYMFLEQKIKCENGVIIDLRADTFCLHGDTPNSLKILRYLHQEFDARNIQIQ